jgi:hypothetical protein
MDLIRLFSCPRTQTRLCDCASDAVRQSRAAATAPHRHDFRLRLPKPDSRQAFLSAGAVGPGIAAGAVVAESATVVASACLLAVTSRRLALGLIQIVGTALILIETCAVLLIEVWVVGASKLLPTILPKISPCCCLTEAGCISG